LFEVNLREIVNYSKKKSPSSQGIELKKKYGQHFLRDQSVVDHMIQKVTLTPQTSLFEIGCGDGFLTRSILEQNIARLWIFEIDPEWATYVQQKYADPRLTVFQENFLDLDFSRLIYHAPWTLLANLPYSVSFPIMYKLHENFRLIKEGVVMVQEEVAQKMVKTGGRGYGFPALFLQHRFEFTLLRKVPPGVFYPPPKVYSRLVYFKPKAIVEDIPDEEMFWRFIKLCFHQPRRTLKNNLEQGHFNLENVPEKTLQLRAQQMGMQELLELWNLIRQ
jgi:16S rRNA (adenine1518-N6/adenine1519-N6)-dimethyltransferase